MITHLLTAGWASALFLLAAPAFAQPAPVPRYVAPTDCSLTLTTAGTPYSVTLKSGAVYQFSNSDVTDNSNIYISTTQTTPSAKSAGSMLLLLGGSWQAPPGTMGVYMVYAVGTVNGQILQCTLYQ